MTGRSAIDLLCILSSWSPPQFDNQTRMLEVNNDNCFGRQPYSSLRSKQTSRRPRRCCMPPSRVTTRSLQVPPVQLDLFLNPMDPPRPLIHAVSTRWMHHPRASWVEIGHSIDRSFPFVYVASRLSSTAADDPTFGIEASSRAELKRPPCNLD